MPSPTPSAAIERAVVVFLDGVGLGDDDPAVNPLAGTPMPTLECLLGGRRPVRDAMGTATGAATLLGLDARLGVPGLPQSGTGQTTILTGVNAAARLGRHDGPYPNGLLQDLLRRGTLFTALLRRQRPVAYANAYTDRFLGRIARGTERLSANTRAALLAGLTLRGPADLADGRAVSSLFTNAYFRQHGYAVPDVTPEQAGRQLARLAADHTLTFFEFWFTDVAGHRQNHALAREILIQLDGFLAGALAGLDLTRSWLLVISDHGNFEDLSTPRHTLNPALAVLIGAGHADVAAHLTDLTRLTPMLLRALGAAPFTADNDRPFLSVVSP